MFNWYSRYIVVSVLKTLASILWSGKFDNCIILPSICLHLVSSLQIFRQKNLFAVLIIIACYMLNPSYPPWSDWISVEECKLWSRSIRIFVQSPATSSLMVLLLISRNMKIHLRVFTCVTFERCSSKIRTRIFCDTLQSNQAAHLANTISSKEQEWKRSAGRRIFFPCVTQGTLRRRVDDVMKLAVRHSTALFPSFISSRHCKVFVFTSRDGRLYFLDASVVLGKQHL
jgi:hypothetical protein